MPTVFITSGTSSVLPSDFGAPWSVEVIGGGGGGSRRGTAGYAGPGGGGAGYAKITNADRSLSAGQTVYHSIGAGSASHSNTAGSTGGNTWFNGTSNADPTLTSQGARAKGGGGGGNEHRRRGRNSGRLPRLYQDWRRQWWR